jgi:prephenate dehydrogenase
MSGDGFPRSVTIYGTGLIGASFGLALKAHSPSTRVLGIDSPEILKTAQRLGAIDEAAQNNSQPSDLIVLAAPVGVILNLIGDLPTASPIVLDVGSTKVQICRKAESHGLTFVGGHPMTGSEKSGPEAASAELFRGSPFFLCPASSVPNSVVAKVTRTVEILGAHPVLMSAEEHDRIVAQLSHLPQLLSTLLADQTTEQSDFAGPGWKSMTRLAASPFSIWKDILKTSGSLPLELRLFTDRLRTVLDALERGDMKEIEAMFERARRTVSE